MAHSRVNQRLKPFPTPVCRLELTSMTPIDGDNLTAAFEEMLPALARVLPVDQIGQLQTVIDYDEHELAFEMLSAMLREAQATVPRESRACFLELARHLQIDAAIWRVVCSPYPTP